MNLTDFESDYSALFNAIRKVVPPSMKIYLVGGAVRDIVLGRKIRDFDFTVEGLVRPIGKNIANELGGAYYVLDDEREMVRVIIEDEQIGKFDVDIAQLSGDTIEDDLLERDFTFNAMAIDIGRSDVLVDPLGGMNDMQQKMLRMCAPDSLTNDPLRSLRAIRMCLEFDMTMDDDLLSAMYEARNNLTASSMERYRDEMFKIIRLHKNEDALRLMRQFGLIDHLFPEWNRDGDLNLDWIRITDHFSLILTGNTKSFSPQDDFDSFAASRLGNYKETLKAFFDKPLALYHDRRMLNLFAAIAGTLDKRIEAAAGWCSRLAFSSSEINFVKGALNSFNELISLSDPDSFNDVDIYRYFRNYKESGIAGLILYLADGYQYKEIPNAYKKWSEKVVFVQNMFAAYFTRYMEVIAPIPFMSGHDIQELLGIPAGPIVGQIKNSMIEAQISGAVKNKTEAESFIRLEAKHYL